MKDVSDPKRLLAATVRGSVLERGLTMARDRGPTEAELSALRASLFGGATGGAALVERTARAGARAGRTAGSTGWRALGLTKAATALVVTSALAGVAAVGWHRTRALQPEHQAPSLTLLPPATPSPAMVVERSNAPAPLARRAIPTPAKGERLRPEAVAVSPRKHAVALRRPAAPPGTTANPTDADADADADEELVLLGEAQHALPKDPELALALVREHERRYPNGLLGQEREAVAVSALWQIGRRDEARRRAERFAEDHPRSTYLGRMQQMLAPPGDENSADKRTDKSDDVPPSTVGGYK